MIRKLIVGGLVAAGVMTFAFGRDVWSYVRTGTGQVRNAIKAEVPLEFEMQRAREVVENLVPEIRQCMHIIAEQQVDVKHLEQQLAIAETEMADQKEVILNMRADLDSGKSQFVYASHQYSADQVRHDLELRFSKFQNADERMQRERNILEARKKALAANQEKLETLLATKQTLAVEIEQLEARHQTIQAAEAVQYVEIDDSQLNRAKTLITELNKQLDVKEKMLDVPQQFNGLIPVEKEIADRQDVVTKIDSYFGTAPKSINMTQAE
ncbi:MAG: hypothetical protein O2955_19645 [Planctomycetota bacterium]|nr:hypothetical protein [Planctomycetota bacterium]